MSNRRALVIAVSLLGLAAGCGGSDEPPASQAASPLPVTTTVAATPSVSSSTSLSPSATPSPTQVQPQGCAPQGNGIPEGASSGSTIDVDGDGKRDRAWIEDAAGMTLAGITTASGATFSTTYESASPIGRSVLVAPVAGDDLVLIDSGRTTSLYVVQECGIAAVLNAQGEQYTFDRTGGFGTGIGCSRVSGASEVTLVGLLYDADAGTVKRTQVLLDGAQARNGRSDVVRAPRGSAAATSAFAVSCGDLTLQGNGVAAPEQ